MSTPTDGPVDPFGHGLPKSADMPPLMRLWFRPIEGLAPVLNGTVDKPIGQFTMPELLAWALTMGYIFSSVLVAEALVLNLARVAIRGR